MNGDVGISLLFWIWAEIYVIWYLHPVIGGHLRFRTYHLSLIIRISPVPLPDPKTWHVEFRGCHAYKLRYVLYHIYFRLQVAIFDSSQIQTSGSLYCSLVVQPNHKNIGIAVGIPLLSHIPAEICVISYILPVTGSHLWFLTNPHVGQSLLQSSLVVLPDLENIGIAVGISLLSCIRADLYVMSFLLPVMAAIFNLRHTHTSVNILFCLPELPDPENMDLAVGMALLSCTRAEIYVISYLLAVYGRHLGFTTHSDIGQYFHLFLHVLWPQNMA